MSGEKTNGENGTTNTTPVNFIDSKHDVSIDEGKLEDFVQSKVDERLSKVGVTGGTKSGGAVNAGPVLVGSDAGCAHETVQAAVDKAPDHDPDASGASAGAEIRIDESYEGRKHQETIWIDCKQVDIRGHERSSAAIYPEDGKYAFVIEGTSSYDYPSTRGIRDVAVCGGAGAILAGGCVQLNVERMQVVGSQEAVRMTTGAGVQADKTKPVDVESVFRDVNCHFLEGDAFTVESGAANNKTLFDSCTVNRTKGKGFCVTGAASTIRNATIQFTDKEAIEYLGGPNLSVSVVGSYFESNGASLDYPRDIELHAGRAPSVRNCYFNAGSHSKRAINELGGTYGQYRANTYNNYGENGGGFIGVHSDAVKPDVYHNTNNGIAPLVQMAHTKVLSHGHVMYDDNGQLVEGDVDWGQAKPRVALDT